MPIAALYSRVSTSSGEQLQALEQQQARLRAAVPDGYTPVEYTDVLSGTDLDRPEFNRLMADVRQGGIGMVLSTRLDRLSRNRTHGAELLDTFSADGAPRLYLLDDQLDLASVGGRLMAGILSAWAVAESERIGERTAHGHARRRQLGKPFGPKPPRGYVWNDDRSNYQPGPDAALCRSVVARFQYDPMVRPTMRWAAEQGLVFPSASSFVRWIQNPALAGARVYGVSSKIAIADPKRPGQQKTIRRHNKPGHYGEVRWDAHEQLISREQHAWLLAHFATNREQAVQPLRDGRIRVATGLGVCSHCVKRLSVHQSGANAPRYYRCNNQLCEKRYRNRVPEMAIIIAACQRMQHEAAALTAAAADLASQQSLSEPQEVTDLREQIAQARSLNNPRLAAAIAEMEAELRLLLTRGAPRHRLDLEKVEQFFGDIESWKRMYEESPAALRELLLGYVVAVQVRDCEVEGVVTKGDLDAYGATLKQQG